MIRLLSWGLLLAISTLGSPAQAQTATAAATAVAATLPETLSARQADNLAALGQVWGFLKYFHPAVAAGQRDWDAELRRQLPRVLNCRSGAERSRVLSAWVSSLGPVPPCPGCAAPPARPVQQTTDLRWAENRRRFSAPLRRQLAFVYANRYQGEPYYATKVGPGNPGFAHEEAYADQPCPPAELRVLALCRYWNLVQYYYPYKYTLTEDWARVLPELLPRFVGANTPLAYRHAALALFTRVQDGHARFYPPDPLLEAERGEYQVAASVQFLDEQAVVSGVRHDARVPASPLAPGDVITHYAGTAVAELLRQRLPETPGSNRAAQLHTIAQSLLFSPVPQVAVQVLRAGQPLQLTVPCVKVGAVPPAAPAAADSMYRLLTPEVGYIDMARITRAKLPTIMRAFAHTKGIVIDQRNYPGEFVSWLLPTYFLARPAAFVKCTTFDPACPGRFSWMPVDTLRAVGPAQAYQGRVVVLLNESSRSQAEFTAMGLQASGRCTLLGSQTAGADGDVSRIVLPGGLKTIFTGIGVYYPDGRETQHIGLVPDVPVRPTIAGLRAGRDELRERAVQFILTGS